MIFKKLDNRFKLKKAGLALYYLDIDVHGGNRYEEVRDAMTAAFGQGQRVFEWYTGRDLNQRFKHYGDWFYAMERTKPDYGKAPLSSGKLYWRFYFRREEQVAYLKLALSA